MTDFPVTIAYVLNTYPQPSHSFIRREARALEAQGIPILRLAMRRPTMPLVDPQDHEEEAQTDYVLEKGALALGRALLSRLFKSPGAWRRGLCLAMRTGKRHPMGRLRHLIYFAEACYIANRCEKAGVTHIHSHFGTNSAAVAMLAHAIGGPGYSFTVHGPEEFDAPVALSLGDKMANAAFTVAISSFGRSQLCRWVDHTHWPRLTVVHCGIDPAKFPTSEPVEPGAPRLVSIGRFSEQKGQLVLIEAMARIVEAHPKAHLALAGDGEMRPQIEAAIKAHGLSDNITLTGWLSEEEVRQELTRAQALVMPSFAEGLPMVIMEAMAAGRPVISTYIAGIPELVQPGKTGWLVPAGDVGALAKAVDDLAACDAETLTRMGKAGRARALDRHDVGKEAAKLATHFAQALG